MKLLSSPWIKRNKILLIVFIILSVTVITLSVSQINYTTSRSREALLLASLTSASRLSDQETIRTAASLARRVPVVNITECNPDPKIFRLDPSQEQIFRNTDQKTHILTFSADKIFTLSPGDTTIKINFLRPEGISPYFCDGIKKPVGAMYLGE